MAVTVLIKDTGEKVTGKFAVMEGETVGIFSGIMSDKKGGFRGCGWKRIFSAAAVTITADDPTNEIKRP